MRPASVRSTVNRRIGTERPWALPVGRVAADLATDPVVGLPAGEAASRLARFGKNVLVELGRAEQAMAALKAMAAPVVRVRGVAGRRRTCPRPRWCPATWSCSGRATCSPPTCAWPSRGSSSGSSSAVPKVPPFTCRMALLRRTGCEHAAAGRVSCTRRRR